MPVRLVLAVAAPAALALAWRAAPVGDWVDRGLDPIRRLGAWGAALYVALYVLGAVLVVPGSALTLAAGALYGAAPGTALASLGSTLGATAAFLVARALGRDRVRRWAHDDPRLAALDRAVAERGGRCVLLLRLSPLIPFNLLNYALGATGVGVVSYMLATWAGMLPITAFVATVGASFGPHGRAGGVGTLGWALALVSTGAASLVLGRSARSALARVEARPCPPNPTSPP